MTRPEHSVAELRDDGDTSRLGTAFAIAPSLAVTAFHCVRGSERVRLHFPEHVASALVIRHEHGADEDNDLALLRLDEPLPMSVPKLQLQRDAREDAQVTAIGFPFAMAAPRFVVGGTIRSAHAEHPTRRYPERPDRYLQWFCEEALSGVALRGMSGAPLLTGPAGQRAAIGVVVYNEADDQGVATGAAIWAASVATLTKLWPLEIGPLVHQLVNVIITGPASREHLVTGKPIGEWNALDLGVHPAIDSEPANSDSLPSYVRRPHDSELRDLLSGARGGMMVILTGGSCTGKTRACYEAVRECLASWTMFCPVNAPELEQLLDERWLGEKTVVWLDEAHTYLDGQQQGAPEALQGLQRALTSESRPLIAIGSMPRDRGLELMAEPKAGQHDPHRQARKLQHMRAFHQIEVPDDFSLAEPGELRELGRAADHDPRLATAQRAGGDRLQITQVLAGGLLMLDRYLHPTDIYSQAVITAAMDARRLGHSDALAPALLEEAVPGYLAADRRISSEHWFAAALDKAAEAVRGVRALTPTRRRPGIGDPDGYILHDYLDEYARTTREALAPPASLWDALLTCTTSTADLIRVADEARNRGLYRYAVLTAARAAEAGDTGAILFVARLLDEAGRIDESIAWLRPFAEVGDPEAMLLLAAELLKSRVEGRYSENVSWLRRAAESGNSRAMWDLVELFGTRSVAAQAPALAEEAIGWLRQLASGQDMNAMQRLAELLDDMGQSGEAASWRELHEQRTEARRTRWREGLARTLESEGRAEEAAVLRRGEGPTHLGTLFPPARDEEDVTAVRRAAESGDSRAMERLAGLLQKTGKTGEATGWLRRAAEAGQDTAAWDLAQVLQRSGHDQEALTTIQRAAGRWSDAWIAFELVIPWLRKIGGQSSLESFLTAAADAGNTWAIVYLAPELERKGQAVQAIRWLRTAAEKKNLAAMEFLGVLLDQVGQGAEARAWYQCVGQAASPHWLSILAEMLENNGWPERALVRYRHAIECGRTEAIKFMTELLRSMGRADEAINVEAFGIEPGGHTALPWQVPSATSQGPVPAER